MMMMMIFYFLKAIYMKRYYLFDVSFVSLSPVSPLFCVYANMHFPHFNASQRAIFLSIEPTFLIYVCDQMRSMDDQPNCLYYQTKQLIC